MKGRSISCLLCGFSCAMVRSNKPRLRRKSPRLQLGVCRGTPSTRGGVVVNVRAAAAPVFHHRFQKTATTTCSTAPRQEVSSERWQQALDLSRRGLFQPRRRFIRRLTQLEFDCRRKEAAAFCTRGDLGEDLCLNGIRNAKVSNIHYLCGLLLLPVSSGSCATPLVSPFSDSSHVRVVRCHALMSYTINSAPFLGLNRRSLLCFCQIAVFVLEFPV